MQLIRVLSFFVFFAIHNKTVARLATLKLYNLRFRYVGHFAIVKSGVVCRARVI